MPHLKRLSPWGRYAHDALGTALNWRNLWTTSLCDSIL